MKRYIVAVLIVSSFIAGFFSYTVVENYFPQALHQGYTYTGYLDDALNHYRMNVLNHQATIGRKASVKSDMSDGTQPVLACEYNLFNGSTVFIKVTALETSTYYMTPITELQFLALREETAR